MDYLFRLIHIHRNIVNKQLMNAWLLQYNTIIFEQKYLKIINQQKTTSHSGFFVIVDTFPLTDDSCFKRVDRTCTFKINDNEYCCFS